MASKRSRDIVIAIKKETTSGTYNAPSSSTDVLPIIDAALAPEIQQILDGRREGGLDSGVATPGRVTAVGTITTELLGDGSTPVCPAELKVLLEIGGWLFGSTTVIPSTGVADCTAGGANSLTVDTTAETDFPTTDDALVGMDVELSGNPSTAERRTIATYVMSGTDAVMTFTRPPSVTLDNTTKVKVFPNERAVLHSGDIPTASVDMYLSGRKSAHAAIAADLTFNWAAGARATVQAALRGKFQGARSDVTQPTPTLPTLLAPIWRGGVLRIGGLQGRVNTMAYALGNQFGSYGSPEDEEGFGGYEITGRDPRLTMDPKLGLMSEFDWQGAARAGTEYVVHAQIGTAANNRITQLVRRAKPLSVSDTNTEGLAGENVTFKCEGRDAVVGILCWSE